MKSKVLILESTYETCAAAVDRAFAAFPLDVAGKKVVVKVNALRACNPDTEAIVTHPALVAAVVRKLEALKPRELIVGDSVGTESYGNSRHIFARTGLLKAAEPYYRNLSLNLKMVTLEKPFRREVAVLRDVVESDVYIALPKMKTHGLTMISGAVKHNYGILAGAQKSWYHFYSEEPARFAEVLIEMYRLRPPELVIMDAILAMEGYGPCSPETHAVNKLLVSTDAVALDTVEARLVGFDVDDVPYLRIARELGLGQTDLGRIEVAGDASPIPGFKKPTIMPEATYCYLSGVGGGKTSRQFYTDKVSLRPVIDAAKCQAACKACFTVCPAGALAEGHPPALDSDKCILCSACMEACEYGALQLHSDANVACRLGCAPAGG
jgi:uncharacterized protein (DUF362 family)/NAD-dependent dihydropyrimidine dehydrogenase PreA subunit